MSDYPPTLTVCGVTWTGRGIGRVLTYRPLDGSAPIRFAVWNRGDLWREQETVSEAIQKYQEIHVRKFHRNGIIRDDDADEVHGQNP